MKMNITSIYNDATTNLYVSSQQSINDYLTCSSVLAPTRIILNNQSFSENYLTDEELKTSILLNR